MPPTPTDYPHTPEPWTAKHDRIFAADPHDGIPSQVAMTTYSAFTWEQEEANATRIVTCVNACAGMADPAADIAAMRRALTECADLLPYVSAVLDSAGKRASADTVRDLVGTVRRLLRSSP